MAHPALKLKEKTVAELASYVFSEREVVRIVDSGGEPTGQVAHAKKGGGAGNYQLSVGDNGTLPLNGVTNEHLAQMAAGRIKGRPQGSSTGDPVDLTAAQLVAILDAYFGNTDWRTPGEGGGTGGGLAYTDLHHTFAAAAGVPPSDPAADPASYTPKFQGQEAWNSTTKEWWRAARQNSDDSLAWELIGKFDADTQQIQVPIADPASGFIALWLDNAVMGTVTEVGLTFIDGEDPSASVTPQIANNAAGAGATSMTNGGVAATFTTTSGKGAISVDGANTLAKTGATGRVIGLQLGSVTGGATLAIATIVGTRS